MMREFRCSPASTRAPIPDGLSGRPHRRRGWSAVISEIAGRFALDQIVDAHRKLESDPHGKVIVLPGL